jgi:hypothetical protein
MPPNTYIPTTQQFSPSKFTQILPQSTLSQYNTEEALQPIISQSTLLETEKLGTDDSSTTEFSLYKDLFGYDPD